MASSWSAKVKSFRSEARNRAWRSRCWRPVEGLLSQPTDCATSCGESTHQKTRLAFCKVISRDCVESFGPTPRSSPGHRGTCFRLPDELIDAGRFEQLCKRASLLFEPGCKAELLEDALACWRGSAFEEFAEHDWARLEAMRLDELHILAQEELFEARLALGGHAALVGDLESLVTRHPMRERFWHQLIVALYRSGRSAEALRRAEALRVVLREELGLDPSPAFRELEARVLHDDPTLLQPPVATTSISDPTTSRPSPPGWLVEPRSSCCSLAGSELIGW